MLTVPEGSVPAAKARLRLRTADTGPRGLPVGAWGTGQVAPTHPVWVGHPQRKCLSSFPGCRPEDPAAQSRGRAPTARGRPRAQPPACTGVLRAPRDLPWSLLLTGHPGHTGLLPFSQQSFGVPSSKHVFGGPLCLGAAFRCLRPSRPAGGPRRPQCAGGDCVLCPKLGTRPPLSARPPNRSIIPTATLGRRHSCFSRLFMRSLRPRVVR